MLNTKRLLLVTLAASLLSACDDSTGPPDGDDDDEIVGSGILATKTLSVGGFHGVKARGVARVVITPGSDETVTITADDNILPRLMAEVEDGHLRVGPDTDDLKITTDNEMLFEITYRQIEELDVQGVLVVDVSGLEAEVLTVDLGGVSTLTTEGTADRQVVRVNGVSSYLSSSLESRLVELTGNGVINVVLNVSEELKGNVCGVGTVRYIGEPDVFVTACPAVIVSRLTP